MAKSEQAKAMDELQSKLRPFLKEHGFRWQARTCNRTTADGLTHVINLQMGRFDPPGTNYIPWFRKNLYGKFTINVGVYVPEVGLAEFGLPTGRFIQEPYCCIRMRLAQLSEKSDIWWNLPVNQTTIEDVRGRIERDAFAFFARCGNRDALLQELERGAGTLKPRISQAIIFAHRGDFERARELLKAQAQSATAEHRKYVQQIADHLELGLIVT